MKKLTALFLALMLILSLVACGSEPMPDNTDDQNESQSENLIKDDTEDKADEENTENIDTTEDNADQEDKSEILFTEVVVVDNDECLIKITDIDPDNMWGFALKALLENKSGDKTYMFTVDSAAINGVQSDPLFATEVAPGKKSNESISFMNEDLEKNGVGDYTDIELKFRVYDTNDWLADAVAEVTVHIYPYGEDKAVKFVREAKDSDNVLVDNENVTVIVTGYEKDEIWGYNVNLFLLNKTDKNVMFSVDEASINGFMSDPMFATAVSAGKCAFTSITWFDTELEENSITEVEEIEFTLRAYDEDDWMSGDFVKEVFTLNP